MQNIKTMSDRDLLAVLGVTVSDAGLNLASLFGFSRRKGVGLGESIAEYVVHPAIEASRELVCRAMKQSMIGEEISMSSPSVVRDYLKTQIGGLDHEVFVVIFLDTQNRVIATEEMFRGTISQTSVYPREVVKRALQLNAGAVIFGHNHPSGLSTPSRADEILTGGLKTALGCVDVRVLDHFVVGADEIISFAERGLI